VAVILRRRQEAGAIAGRIRRGTARVLSIPRERLRRSPIIFMGWFGNPIDSLSASWMTNVVVPQNDGGRTLGH
jgi:hypothetical protein